MDADTRDDELTTWAVRLDEPTPVPTGPHVTDPPADAEPLRLALWSRDVPAKDFQPRLRLGEDGLP